MRSVSFLPGIQDIGQRVSHDCERPSGVQGIAQPIDGPDHFLFNAEFSPQVADGKNGGIRHSIDDQIAVVIRHSVERTPGMARISWTTVLDRLGRSSVSMSRTKSQRPNTAET